MVSNSPQTLMLWYYSDFCPAVHHPLLSTLCSFICLCLPSYLPPARVVLPCATPPSLCLPRLRGGLAYGVSGWKITFSNSRGRKKKVLVSIRGLNFLKLVPALLMRSDWWENIWWWRAMTCLVYCPEEDPVMWIPAMGWLMMRKVQIAFTDCSLQDLGLGPR